MQVVESVCWRWRDGVGEALEMVSCLMMGEEKSTVGENNLIRRRVVAVGGSCIWSMVEKRWGW